MAAKWQAGKIMGGTDEAQMALKATGAGANVAQNWQEESGTKVAWLRTA